MKTANEYTKDQLVLLLAQARRRLLNVQTLLEAEGCLEEEDEEDNTAFCELIDIAPEVPDLVRYAAENSKFERIRKAFNEYHAATVWCHIGDIRTQALMQARLPQATLDFGEACYKWLLRDVGLKPEWMAMAGNPEAPP